ncbi:MAG: hypothetical protein RLZZ436_2333, partial [Planctomycetota bacterium]
MVDCGRTGGLEEGGLSACEPLRLDLAEFVIQGFQGDTEFFGGLGFIAMVLIEHSQDHFFFHLPERPGFGVEGGWG